MATVSSAPVAQPTLNLIYMLQCMLKVSDKVSDLIFSPGRHGIIGVFPKSEEQAIRNRIAQSFRYIISQRLLPRADQKGRVAAIEILISTSRTRDYVEKGHNAEGKSLMDAMEQGEQEGMQTFDAVIEHLIRNGIVFRDEVLPYATNQNNLILRLADFAGPNSSPTERSVGGGEHVNASACSTHLSGR
jgi:twitching motility protein PilT